MKYELKIYFWGNLYKSMVEIYASFLCNYLGTCTAINDIPGGPIYKPIIQNPLLIY